LQSGIGDSSHCRIANNLIAKLKIASDGAVRITQIPLKFVTTGNNSTIATGTQITVKNAAGGIIGGPTTFNTNGIQTLTFIKPVANDYLTIQVQKSANGGINPIIRGLQLELN
jgi:hypothetical protein